LHLFHLKSVQQHSYPLHYGWKGDCLIYGHGWFLCDPFAQLHSIAAHGNRIVGHWDL
jgi:hypothetical protein